jgi:hypothetical protein
MDECLGAFVRGEGRRRRPMLDDIEFLIVVNAAAVPAERVSGRSES